MLSTGYNWKPNTWKDVKFKKYQIPTYKNQRLLNESKTKLSKYPPIVFSSEIDKLKMQLAKCHTNDAFIIQGGDCAESFNDFSFDTTIDLVKLLVQTSLVLNTSQNKPIIKIGRMAGQYAKPRSTMYEVFKNNLTNKETNILQFKGDIIHSHNCSVESREPDPNRMLYAYMQSVATLNVLRNVYINDYLSLTDIRHWTHSLLKDNIEFEKVITKIEHSIEFMKNCNMNTDLLQEINKPQIYVSHECLLLDYEEPLTRKSSKNDLYYNCSAHMVWLGDRTRHMDGAHIEFLRGIQNPIGIKVGPNTNYNELIRIISTLNKNNEEGKIVLITRYGKELDEHLPKLLSILNDEKVIFMCDPMHGNTFTVGGRKTRTVSDIIREVRVTSQILNDNDRWLSGIHLEMTGKIVTECIDQHEKFIFNNYESLCDPRLNAIQAMNVALSV